MPDPIGPSEVINFVVMLPNPGGFGRLAQFNVEISPELGIGNVRHEIAVKLHEFVPLIGVAELEGRVQLSHRGVTLEDASFDSIQAFRQEGDHDNAGKTAATAISVSI